MPNPGVGDAPPNFLDALYGGESDYEDEELKLDCVDEQNVLESESFSQVWIPDRAVSLTPPPYSPLSNVSRSRSRSPLRHQSKPTQPQIPSPMEHRETGPPEIIIVVEETEIETNEFFAPDSHALFESVKRREASHSATTESDNERDVRCGPRKRVRTRGPNVARGRVRTRGRDRPQKHCPGHQPSGDDGWCPGQPLEEIWLTDDDVPLDLRQMAMDVISRRKERNAKRTARGPEEDYDSDDVSTYDDAFEWYPMGSFRGVEEPFLPKRTGSVASYTHPYDAFRSFWDDDILQVIVEETNRRADRIQYDAFQRDWYPTNIHELLCLFAFWIMTGIIRMPTTKSYFSNNLLLKTEVFSRITSYRRYINLNRVLHFADTDHENSDRVQVLKPIIDHLNKKFQSNYIPSKDICVGENLVNWNGRQNLKQYIPSKATEFGIKTFELCESATGYLWSFLLTGENSNDNRHGMAKSTSVALALIEPLLNKGYRLFMGSWFSSPWLARFLKRNGTDCVGTLRPSHADVPKLVTGAPLKPGQLVARHSGDVCVLSWFDKKQVNMISTCHGSATGLSRVSSRPSSHLEQFKPQSVLDYNRNMGGVDLKDQTFEPYLLERTHYSKWYIKLFKRLLNYSIHNSRVLLESSLKDRQDDLTFRLQLAHTILIRHHSLIPKSHKASSAKHESPFLSFNIHWPVYVAQTDWDRANKRRGRDKCVLCHHEGRRMQKSSFKCEACNVTLCPVGCFKKYHVNARLR